MKRTYKFLLLLTAGVLLLLKLCVLDQYFLLLLRNRACPAAHALTVIDAGQLGNNIWEYLSLLAIARLYRHKLKLVAYCPETLKAKLEDVFERLSILDDSVMPTYCLDMKNAYTLQLNESLDIDKLVNNSDPIILAKWSARYREILQYGIHNVKKHLRFRRDYKEHTHKKLEEIKTIFGMHQNNVTFIGMHYRGTDYIDLLKNSYNNSFTGPSNHTFYLRAMNYFKKRYKHVIFILITIDFHWLKENLPFLIENNNLIINPNQQDHLKDLTLLSHCNHSIINYGTFGATSALFAGGTTFVYDLGIPLDQRGPTIAMGIAKLLPKWHILPGVR